MINSNSKSCVEDIDDITVLTVALEKEIEFYEKKIREFEEIHELPF